MITISTEDGIMEVDFSKMKVYLEDGEAAKLKRTGKLPSNGHRGYWDIIHPITQYKWVLSIYSHANKTIYSVYDHTRLKRIGHFDLLPRPANSLFLGDC